MTTFINGQYHNNINVNRKHADRTNRESSSKTQGGRISKRTTDKGNFRVQESSCGLEFSRRLTQGVSKLCTKGIQNTASAKPTYSKGKESKEVSNFTFLLLFFLTIMIVWSVFDYYMCISCYPQCYDIECIDNYYTMLNNSGVHR